MKSFQFMLAVLFLAVALLSQRSSAQSLSGQISGGFQAPAARDQEGRRSVVKGTGAKPLGNNLLEVTEPRVTTYNEHDQQDMVIEAPHCIYDNHSNQAYSDSNLTVKTTDGRFALSGSGWRWDPSGSHLIISNQVVALVQKAALQESASNEPTSTSSPTSTNQTVEITSARFVSRGDQASFFGNVLVKDGDSTVRCQELLISFRGPEGVKTIEAIGEVLLVQGETRVQSGRAFYSVQENTLRIVEKPRWESGLREGSAQVLLLDRSENTLLAQGDVYMQLPYTNAPSQNPNISRDQSGTNEFLQIYSDHFHYAAASSNRLAPVAVYSGHVRVLHPQAEIRCDQLNVTFSTNEQVQIITAQREVEIRSDKNTAFGQQAIYNLEEEKITISGNPRWTLEDKSGRSELLVFYPSREEVYALNSVEMLLPVSAVGELNLLGGNPQSPPPADTPVSQLRITSDTFSHQGNVSVFHGEVEVKDSRAQLFSNLLTVFSGASNQVNRIVAEENVRILQPEMIATGQHAKYEVQEGLIYLSGHPRVSTPERSVSAELFLINRNENTFSIRGNYRIEMKRAAQNNNSQSPTEPSPNSL